MKNEQERCEELRELQGRLHEKVFPIAREGMRPGPDGQPVLPTMAFAYGAMQGWLWGMEAFLEKYVGPYRPSDSVTFNLKDVRWDGAGGTAIPVEKEDGDATEEPTDA